ncbi:hypothetical protein OHB54_22660 [Streptomyces sp. NBC_01007]|nr:hypothetical protein OHB54_22660 [Streptomyces sp. NBC_01007]
MIRGIGLGRVRAVTAAVLGAGLLVGVPVALGPGRVDVRVLPAGSSRVLRAQSAGDEDRLTLDRLEQDGGKLMHGGSTFHVRAGFTHHGERALRRVAVSISATERLSFTTEYSNCEYGIEVQTSPENRVLRKAVCLIDVRVERGESVDLAPVALKAGRLARDERVFVGAVPEGAGWSYGPWRDRHRGRGKQLTLARRVGSVPPAARRTDGMSESSLDVPVDNPWDLEVTGAALKGRKGEAVTAGLALDFHGADVQAQLDAENSIPFARVEVQFPEGVTVLSTPEHCGLGNIRARKPFYLCEYGLYTNSFDVPMLRDGFHIAYPFKLRIDDPSRLTGGRILVDAPAERLRDDADPTNSTAPITIEAIEAIGEAGGSGGAAWAAAAGAGVLALTGLLAVALVRARRRTN